MAKKPHAPKDSCWMCGGWGWIHPLDTGETWHTASGRTGPVLVWAASRAQHQPGDINCPACGGGGYAELVISKYPGEPLSIETKLW